MSISELRAGKGLVFGALSALTLAAALTASGCASEVICHGACDGSGRGNLAGEGGEGGEEEGGTSGGGEDGLGGGPDQGAGGAGGGVAGGTRALVYDPSKVPAPPEPESGSTSVTTGGSWEPPPLRLSLSSEANLSCGDPEPEIACGGRWEVTVNLPADPQPGVYPLDCETGLCVSFWETTESYSEDPEDCGFGGGGGLDGTLEIVSVTPEAIVVRFSDIWWLSGVEGEHVAPRCD